MSDRTEALARVLDPWAFESARRHSARAMATATATRILADPGPLLDALTEAGVLQDRSRVRTAMVYDGDTPVDRVLVTERRYITVWQEAGR